jgi:hypothetical protein
MRAVLEQNNFAPSADCMVPIALSDSDMDNTNNTSGSNNTEGGDSSGTTSGAYEAKKILSTVFGIGCMIMLSAIIL